MKLIEFSYYIDRMDEESYNPEVWARCPQIQWLRDQGCKLDTQFREHDYLHQMDRYSCRTTITPELYTMFCLKFDNRAVITIDVEME